MTSPFAPPSSAADEATRARIAAVRRASFTLAFCVLLIVGLVAQLDIWSFVALELVLVAGMLVFDRVSLSRSAPQVPADPVAAALAILVRDGWRTIQDVPLPRGMVDHVVIGPGGVFALETRGEHDAAIDLQRLDELALRRAHHNALALDDLMRHPVVPLLVLRGADLRGPVELPRGIVVLADALLGPYLRQAPRVLGVSDVAELHGRLRARVRAA